MANLIILDGNPSSRKTIESILQSQSAWSSFFVETTDAAVELVQNGPVDLLIVDLETTCCQCLDLIQQCAPVPSIVISGETGCQEVVDILEAGATNYLPKTFLQERLIDVIEKTLSSSRETRQRMRLLGCMEESYSSYSLPLDMQILAAAANRLEASLSMFGICENGENIGVRIAIDEALANAYYHGSLEVSSDLKEQPGGAFEKLAQQRKSELPYRERRILVEEHINRDAAKFIIHDEGPGFDLASLDNPTEEEFLDRPSGRGIAIMRHFLDDVIYNPTGNQVTLVKYRKSTSQPPFETDQIILADQPLGAV